MKIWDTTGITSREAKYLLAVAMITVFVSNKGQKYLNLLNIYREI